MTDTLSTPSTSSVPIVPAARMGASAWGRIAVCVVLALPAVVFRLGGFAPNPLVDLLVFGGAVVAASFLLAWAAEAAQKDIAGALAIAILALIASVLCDTG